MKLITGGTVVTMNEKEEIWSPGFVAIEGNKIVGVGPIKDLPKFSEKASEILDARNSVVMPGLVNAHTHAPMTLFRGLADDLPLRKWLEKHIFPVESKLTEDMIYWGTLLACSEMLLSGTTTFCDMYLFEHKVAEATDKAGMRAVLGEVLYDFPSPHYGPLERGYEFTESFIKEWKGHPRIRISVDPHAVYTCSPELLKKSYEIAEKYDVLWVIHLSETEDEVQESLRRYKKTPVEHLEAIGVLSERVVAVHCVVLNPEDIERLSKKGVTVVHNPESNLKLASGIAPVVELVKRGVSLCLGTDGCASNNNLDMFQEMDTCAKIHKGLLLDPTVLPAKEVLKMATVEGAKRLWSGEKLGVIEEGALADVIVLDFQKPHLIPCYDPISHIVYSASGSDIKDVMVDGRWVVKDRKIQTIDLEEVIFHVKRFAEEIGRFRRS